MFDFLIRNFVVKGAQKAIDRMDPAVKVHIPQDLPLPSIKIIRKYCTIATRINAMEKDFEALTDEQLRGKTSEFRKKYQEAVNSFREAIHKIENEFKDLKTQQEREAKIIQLEKAKEELKKAKRKATDEMLPEAFAVAREASKRTLKMRHFDIQLVGGMVLNSGSIAEMATGEGKTLTATLPAYLNAVTGEGVHVVTVNDYLARRDRDWMGPIFEFLGLTVGVIQHDIEPEDRRAAYECDITYGTNNEFGFDYLRDNMVNFKDEMVQREHNYAIVDEVDSILIDEARTPLIISGPAEESTDKYYRAYEITRNLKGRKITEAEEIDAKYKEIDLTTGFDYIADEKARSISLTETGETKACELFGIENMHDMDTIEYRHHILQALKAKEFFRRDVDYVVRDGQVIIVDEFTGRMMPGRRWSDGLHQAVEAREGIKIERENQTLATITFQNYFKMYDKLSGMTGTAYTEAGEFEQIYELDCVVMPTNRVLQRKNHPDCIYKTRKAKFRAVVEEIKECNERGQPVLVGTISIENSELLSKLLEQRGIKHQVLNAKYHEHEAHIVAQAGRYRGVTIATNMAGRGTDILLGGNAEFMAQSLMDEKFKDLEEGDERKEKLKKFLAEFQEKTKEERQKVIEAGGLHVLGTERHESRRIDNQLRGRSGRQGDPGSSRFYVSFEDDLMRLFASDKVTTFMERMGLEEDQVIESGLVSRTLEMAQRRVEQHNFEIRKQLLEFDNVMNKQREVIYDLRRKILESNDVRRHIREALEETIDVALDQYLFSTSVQPEGDYENPDQAGWDVEGLDLYIKSKFNTDLKITQESIQDKERDKILESLMIGITQAYQQKQAQVGEEEMRHMEKILLLHTIDAKWKDHLYEMDKLKEGIGLRSYGQRDPIMEYKKEGFEMFRAMNGSINREVAETIFKIQPIKQDVRGVFSSLPQKMEHGEVSSFEGRSPIPQAPAAAPVPPAGHQPPRPMVKDSPKVGRNDPCPCGSGKKYKKCCGK